MKLTLRAPLGATPRALGLLLPVIVVLVPADALAYTGPGAALGMLGTFLAVLAAVVIALIGVVLIPLRMIKAAMREKAAKAAAGEQAAPERTDG